MDGVALFAELLTILIGLFFIVASGVFLIVVPRYLKKMVEKMDVLYAQAANLNRIALALEVKKAHVQQHRENDHHQPCVSDIDQQHRNTGGYQYYSNIPSGDILPHKGFDKT